MATNVGAWSALEHCSVFHFFQFLAKSAEWLLSYGRWSWRIGVGLDLFHCGGIRSILPPVLYKIESPPYKCGNIGTNNLIYGTFLWTKSVQRFQNFFADRRECQVPVFTIKIGTHIRSTIPPFCHLTQNKSTIIIAKQCEHVATNHEQQHGTSMMLKLTSSTI